MKPRIKVGQEVWVKAKYRCEYDSSPKSKGVIVLEVEDARHPGEAVLVGATVGRVRFRRDK